MEPEVKLDNCADQSAGNAAKMCHNGKQYAKSHNDYTKLESEVVPAAILDL